MIVESDRQFFSRGIAPLTRVLMFLLFLPCAFSMACAAVLFSLDPPRLGNRILDLTGKVIFPSVFGAAAWACAAGVLASILPKPKCHTVTLWMVRKLAICVLWLLIISLVGVVVSIVAKTFRN